MVRVINPPSFLGVLANPGGRRKRRKSRRPRRSRRTARRSARRAARSASGRFLKKSHRKRRPARRHRRARKVSARPTRNHMARRARKHSRRRARRNPGGAMVAGFASPFKEMAKPKEWGKDALAIGAGLVLPNMALGYARRWWVPSSRPMTYLGKAVAIGAVTGLAGAITSKATARKVFLGGMASLVLDLYADFVAPWLSGMMGGATATPPAAPGTAAYYGPGIGAYYGPGIGFDPAGSDEGAMGEVSHLADVG